MVDTSDPAFPGESEAQTGNSTWLFQGLTKREYFAAIAMQGIAKEPGEGCDGYIAQRARVAVAIADALLVELAK